MKTPTRKAMEKNARAYNRHIRKDYIDRLSDYQLLGLTHPLRRVEFLRLLTKDREATKNHEHIQD